MSFYNKIALLVLSLVMLYFSWPPFFGGPIIYFALIPFFIVLEQYRTKRNIKSYFIMVIMHFLVLFGFSILQSFDAWGSYNSNVYMAALMEFVPFCLLLPSFIIIRDKYYSWIYYILLWGSLEYFQMYWQMNSPLMALGNVLAYFPSITQHYAIWGVTGGSVFILLINLYLLKIFFNVKNQALVTKTNIVFGILLALVFIFSFITYNIPEKVTNKLNIAMLSGNFEHFTKENNDDPYRLINYYNNLYHKIKDQKTDIILLPESATVKNDWIENLNNSKIKNPIDDMLSSQNILFGSHLFSIFHGKLSDKPYDVRYDANSRVYYQSHNCAVFRSELGVYTIRSKDKNVPFHEVIPYANYLMFTEKWFNKSAFPLYLSSYKGSAKKPFSTSKKKKVFGVMCFEAFFSDVIIQQPDADFIAVLSNESWSDQDKGKEQFFAYMGPKAIESGKTIVKIANEGYSGMINSKGQILRKMNFKKALAETIEVNASTGASLYSHLFPFWRGLYILGFIFILLYNKFKT